MDIVISLALGMALQAVIFFTLRRLAGFGAKQAATVIALLAVALYMPYAILDWPGGDVVSLHLAIYLVTAYALGLILANREARLAREGEDARWFHWGPAVIVSFFVVLILFDGILVVVASRGLPESLAEWFFPSPDAGEEISSAFPGVVSHDYQEKQAHFNAYLEQLEKQQLRGWRVNKGWLIEPSTHTPGRFQVTVVAADASPVSGAQVTGTFLRPSDTRLDQTFSLTETAPGVYRGDIQLPKPGQWNLVLEIRKGDDLHQVRAGTTVKE